LEATDLSGTPTSQVGIGDDFILNGYVEDLRTVSPHPLFDGRGVFAAYLDITYDFSLASVSGPITHGTQYGQGTSGDTSTPGLIDEVGSFRGSLMPPGPGEILLFQTPFTADAIGTVNFVADPAEDSPAHDIGIYGVDDPIPISDVSYGSTAVTIVPEPSAFLFGGLVAMTTGGYCWVRRKLSHTVMLEDASSIRRYPISIRSLPSNTMVGTFAMLFIISSVVMCHSFDDYGLFLNSKPHAIVTGTQAKMTGKVTTKRPYPAYLRPTT
jgi:hypothetical protein